MSKYYVVIGYYANHDSKEIARYLHIDWARFEAAYQSHFYNEVVICDSNNKLVARFVNEAGHIREVPIDK